MQPLDYTVSGPLTGHGHPFADYLQYLGYAPTSIGLRLNLLRHFSNWLTTHCPSPNQCDDTVLDKYYQQRATTHTDMATVGKIAPLVAYLRSTGVIAPPRPIPPKARNKHDELLDTWCDYLHDERGLHLATTRSYRRYAKPFVDACLPEEHTHPTAQSVTRFISTHLPRLSINGATTTVTAVRSLLKYLDHLGRLPEPLDPLILRPRAYRNSTIPRGLPATDVDTLITTTSTDTIHGRRNHAILLLLARLGLRAHEVAALTLDDLDWAHGTIRIHSKGGYIDHMPLPVDVGTAIAEYLTAPKNPAITGRALFHSARAPYRPITSSTVKSVVRTTANTAGLGPIGAHRLRHTLATTTINTGASLEEVAQLLRHRHLTSTMIYAKVDLTRLTLITRPWPKTTTTGKGDS